MKLRNLSVALHDVIGGGLLILLLAAIGSIGAVVPARAQTADDGGSPAVAGTAPSDSSPDGNVDVPAPAADYDLPADASAGADTGEVAATDDRVLELPQVLDPADYAAAEPVSANPEPPVANAAPPDS